MFYLTEPVRMKRAISTDWALNCSLAVTASGLLRTKNVDVKIKLTTTQIQM